MYENNRNSEYFEYPQISTRQRIFSALVAIVTPKTRLVDISDFQKGEINFPVLATGVDGVVIRATKGLEKDESFDTFWPQALDAGLIVGTYGLFDATKGGIAQANFHLETIQALRDATQDGIIPPHEDVELVDGVANSSRINKLYNCLQYLESNFKKPGIYSSIYFIDLLLTPVPTWMNQFWHWVAHWTSAAEPSIHSSIDKTLVKLWQYGIWLKYPWVDPVPGVSGDIDVNWFFGTKDQLKEYADYVEPIPPTPPNNFQEQIDALDERLKYLESLGILDKLNNLDSRLGALEELEPIIQNITVIQNTVNTHEQIIEAVRNILNQ